MTLLDRDEIISLLAELATELDARGVDARLFVVGGAAMAIAFGRDRATRDVDGIFEPTSPVREAAAAVGRRHGLAGGWLNDAVKGYLLGEDPDATTALELPGLTVQVASPSYLFVMKALAARAERDSDDLVWLYRQCGFRNVDEAMAHLDSTAPPVLLTPRVRFYVEELLGSLME